MIRRIKKAIQMHDRAVSPVIGVVLMVAIAVILAAVVGSFVLGLGSQLNNGAPVVSLSAADAADRQEPSPSADTLFEITHNSGPPLPFQNLEIIVRDADTGERIVVFDRSTDPSRARTGDPAVRLKLNGNFIQSDDSISAGDKLTIVEDFHANRLPSGANYQIQIIYTQSESPTIILETAVVLD